MNGFLFIDKPKDWTSRDVCNRLQHLFHEKKVGHTGTLDPFATGLLIVCFGNATKTIPLLEDADKEYLAELTLGTKTSTGDLTGEVIETREVGDVSGQKIKEVFSSLVGEMDQIPPMTSAVHVNGRKLYTYHYQGQEVERKPRKITIKSCELLSFSQNTIIFKCRVSKGTYLRTLGETIAEKLETVGYLSNLRRLKIADFDVRDSSTLENVKSESLLSLADVLTRYVPFIVVDDHQAQKVKNGMPITIENILQKYDKIMVMNEKRECLAIYTRLNGSLFKCQRGLFS
ncbi:MAG: tRNA pseudouridine(55) synthase TruB [Erysipelotrichaceae bacterium]|nr:tRNA pseudouridine(55) synthase TruB [Erysipelotrichaceae bacterium]